MLSIHELELLKQLHERSTKVASWHVGAAEVRGPFNRWLTVSEVPEMYRSNVASRSDDATYAAYAMNYLPKLIACIEDLRKQRDQLELQLGIETMIVGDHPDKSTTGKVADE